MCFQLGTSFSTSLIRPGSRCFGWPSASPSTMPIFFTRCQTPTTSNATAGRSSVRGWSRSFWIWTTAHPLSEINRMMSLTHPWQPTHTNILKYTSILHFRVILNKQTLYITQNVCQVWLKRDVFHLNSHLTPRLAIWYYRTDVHTSL